MKHELAIVKNVVKSQAAVDALISRNLGVPGMGLFYGKTGFGKTTSVTWLVNQYDGIFIRAAQVWNPTSMLNAILTELGVESVGQLSEKLDSVNTHISMSQRPLFVDEADRLIHNSRLIETLRDIHDITNVPVIMIGEDGLEKKIQNRRRLARRITQWVEFTETTLEDALILRNTISEVSISDDLMTMLHADAEGSIGLMTVGIGRIEQIASSNGWTQTIDPMLWGQKPFFLSRAPKKGGVR